MNFNADVGSSQEKEKSGFHRPAALSARLHRRNSARSERGLLSRQNTLESFVSSLSQMSDVDKNIHRRESWNETAPHNLPSTREKNSDISELANMALFKPAEEKEELTQSSEPDETLQVPKQRQNSPSCPEVKTTQVFGSLDSWDKVIINAILFQSLFK